jgi:hypothetical protein
MKKILMVLAAGLVSMILSATGALAQATITHYSAVGKLDSNRPDFSNAVVATDFGGKIAEKAIAMFRNLNVEDFSLKSAEGTRPCLPTKEVPTLVCIHIESGPGVAINESGSSSGYGRGGGVYEQSSFSGNLYDIYLTVTLIRLGSNGNISSLDLGSSSTIAPAGVSYESISSYGKNGNGGITSMNVNSGLNATIGNAINKDLNSLFEKKGLWGGVKKWNAIAEGARPQWIPGADQEVALAFPGTNAQPQKNMTANPSVAHLNELDNLQQ